ncbi:MAG: DUF2975 domain-containing protein, partial [Bacteroidota bacterium]
PNSLSSLFFYLTRLGFFLSVSIFLVIFLSMMLGYLVYWLDWENSIISLELVPDYELTLKPLELTIGSSNSFVLLFVIATFSFYILTCWFMSQLFKGLMKASIFADSIVKTLRALSIVFFFSSCLSFLRMILSSYDDSDVFAAILLFIICSILFFIKEIFKQGVLIQEEHNLTI